MGGNITARRGFNLDLGYVFLSVVIWLLVVLPDGACGSVKTFGPKRYDRLAGAPTVYTETFTGCTAADRVLLQVWNGNDKASRVTAAEIFVNGIEVLSENDFKAGSDYLERDIVTDADNELKIILKSGSRPTSSFLLLAVTSTSPDISPPVISTLVPANAALLATPRPLIEVAFDDRIDDGSACAALAAASGIDQTRITLTLDGRDVTALATVDTATLSYRPDTDLGEGRHTLSLVVADHSGNLSRRDWFFTIDTSPPGITFVSSPDGTVTRFPEVTIAGGLSESATLSLNGVPLACADGHFATIYRLNEGENRLTLTVIDQAGNRSVMTTTVTLDTRPPLVTVTTPADGSIGNRSPVLISGVIDDPNAMLTVNDEAVTHPGGAFTCPVTLQPGRNTVVLNAVDAVGNLALTSLALDFDARPPVVHIVAPANGETTRNQRMTIVGSIDERADVTLDGTPLVVRGNYFATEVALVEGENVFVVAATDPAGNRGETTVTLRSDRTPPSLALTAPPCAAAGETVPLQLSLSDSSGLTLAETSASELPFWARSLSSDNYTESLVYTLSPDLAPGSSVVLRLHGVDAVGNSADTAATVVVSAGPNGPGYLQGEIYDDRAGLPFADATLRVTGPNVNVAAVTAGDGAYLFELAGGDYRIVASRDGYTTCYRNATLRPESTVAPLDARLTKLATAVEIGYAGGRLTAPLEAGPAWNGNPPSALTLDLPEGALAESLEARFTALSSQGLPAPLPRGWSPLGAFDLRFTAAGAPLPMPVYFFFPATVRLPLGESGPVAGDELVAARYDIASGRWLVAGRALVGTDGTAAAALAQEGSYALLQADPAPSAPPPAQIGTALGEAAATDDTLNGWQVDSTVAPPAAPPSRDLRAVGELRLQPADEFPASGPASGLVLRGRVTEAFDLLSGDVVQPADFSEDLILYRTPCLTGSGAGRIAPLSADGLRASFPITPSRQYTMAELLQGEVGIEIAAPEMSTNRVLAGPNGAQLLSADGIGLTLPAGALEQTVPVQLRPLDASAAAPLVPPGYALLHALRLDLSRRTLQRSALLTLPQPTGFDAQHPVILAQSFTAAGGEHLRAVAVLRPVGSLLSLDTSFAGLLLPGILQGGNYYVLQSAAPLGAVRGTVRTAAGSPFAAALVAPAAGGLADLSAGDGGYLLLAPPGTLRVAALDPARYDRGEGVGTLEGAEGVLNLDVTIRPTVPTVVDLSPEPGADRVEPSAKLVVTFSEPVDRASAGAIRLIDAAGAAVDGVFSFSPDATVVSFYPTTLLAGEGHYRVEIDGVRDLQGYAVVPFAATFTVRDITPPPLPPAGSITATYPDAFGIIDVVATRGSAELGCTVLIVNDTSGEIVSVTPNGDGSFSSRIAAQPGDEVRVELMDAAGNVTPTAWLTFRAPDGRTLVTARGGRVEGEGGLVLDIPAGALVGPTVVRIMPVAENALPHPVPSRAKFLAAVDVDTGGVPFRKEVKLSIPAPENPPADGFAYVTRPTTHVNPDASEEEVYEIVDSAKVAAGRLTCASPPFDGVYSSGLFVFVDLSSFTRIGVTYGTTYRDMDGDNLYNKDVDLPVKGAVIRCAAAQNFISYSGSDGHYAATVFDDTGSCAGSLLTAMHPLTMQKVSSYASACLSGPAARRDIKLADRETPIPDNTPPAITLGLRVVPGQTNNPQLIAGTIPVGTELEVPISIVDQEIEAAYLSVTYQSGAMSAPAPFSPAPSLVQSQVVLHTPMSGETPALYRYDYLSQFFAPLAGSTAQQFRLDQPGTYRLTVEAVDGAGRRAVRTVQVRAIDQTDSVTRLDGPPVVDALLPADGSIDVMVTTAVTVWFNEPLDDASVTPQSFRLIDTATATPVPAQVYTALEGGRMLATLTPLGNLTYGREYRIELNAAIRDLGGNSGVEGDGRLHLAPLSATFTTKVPRVFDLASDPFTASRDIDLYTLGDGSGRTFAAVAAGGSGWRIVEVTDPTRPTVVYSAAAPPNWTYRGVSIDPATGMLGMTLDIYSGSRYGYVQFYSLLDNPAQPVYAGRELLAASNSGIPGRLDLAGGHAYIATVGAGIQVVDVAQATADPAAPSRGNFIVGGYDSAGQGSGEPNDVQVYAPGRMLATTNGGQLLLFGIAVPQTPILEANWKPSGAAVSRAAAVGSYSYSDADGNPAVLDLALAGLSDGRVVTLDLTDPGTPRLLGEAVNDQGEILSHASGNGVFVNDIALNKEAGLAFTAGAMAINVFDIKNPSRPRLLSVIAQLPDESGNLMPLGSTRALVEQGGWVYIANEASGMRVLDLDPHTLVVTPAPVELTGKNTGIAKKDVNIAYELRPDPGFGQATASLQVFEDDRVIWEGAAQTAQKTSLIFPATAKNADQTPKYIFDPAKRYSVGVRLLSTTTGDVFTTSREDRAALPLSWPVLATDYDHNRTIDQSDLDRAARGDTFYFWINDDDDEGETEGSDIPGEKRNLLSSLDMNNTIVDGVRDLIDFFPVTLDVNLLNQLYPVSSAYRYRLKSVQESVKVAFPQLTKGNVGNYLTDVPTARNLAQLTTYRVMSNGDFWINIDDIAQEGAPQPNPAQMLLDQTISAAGEEDEAPILLVEGRNIAKAPLVFEVVDNATNKVIFTSSLNLSLAGVEQMFRHKNLIQVGDGPPAEIGELGEHKAIGGEKDRLGQPSNCPDSECLNSDGKDFVFVHGYNVNGQQARGWQAEIFKRMFWSGSKSRFWGVSWYGADTQFLNAVTLNYHLNVQHAFKTAPKLTMFFNENMKGPVTIAAHSLGNMLVSFCLNDSNQSNNPAEGLTATISNFIMIDAAVALEAYAGDNQNRDELYDSTNPMVHPHWYGYQKRLGASEWHTLFDSSDDRNKLTWRDRFANFPNNINYFNFYSSGEEVLDTHTGDPGLIDIVTDGTGRYAWALQEKLKGRMLTGMVLGSRYGGWKFNVANDDYFVCNPNTLNGTLQEDCAMIVSTDANNLDGEQLKIEPFFDKSFPINFFTEGISTNITEATRTKLLAEAFPALTLPAGGPEGERLSTDETFPPENVKNMQATFSNGWPQERENRDDYRWLHSDIREVSYIFINALFNYISGR